MSRRVTVPSGEEVLLTPRGEVFVRKLGQLGRGLSLGPHTVHPATRDRLLHSRLIRWTNPDRIALELTPLGHDVADLLDQESRQPTPTPPNDIRLTAKQSDALAAICGARPMRESNTTDIARGLVYWQTVHKLVELGLVIVSGPERRLTATDAGRALSQGSGR